MAREASTGGDTANEVSHAWSAMQASLVVQLDQAGSTVAPSCWETRLVAVSTGSPTVTAF